MSAETRPIDGVRQPPPGKLTYEQFLDWCDEDTLAEWVDGEVIVTSPASLPHQDLASFLTALLREVAEADDLGRVLTAPFQMRLHDPPRGREPDVLFVAREHLSRLCPTYLDGPADLVVEIVSPESAARDRGDKFFEYERAGVPEYWLIYPERRRAEFHQLDPAGRYQLVLEGESGVYQSRALPRLRLPLEWLWHEPLPKLRDARRHLDLA